jgi:thymidylate kinase
MLITVSGMVGSGKSTTAKRLIELLSESGMSPTYIRFRSLGVFGFARRPPPNAATDGAAGEHGSHLRATGFKLRRLTAPRALVYAVRMIAFRATGVGRIGRCDVLDRYFYDNLIQYKLTSHLERAYLYVLRQLIPVPDIPVLLVASAETLSMRRPTYAREYVVQASQQYHRIRTIFPNLIQIDTDRPDANDQEILELVRSALRDRPLQ